LMPPPTQQQSSPLLRSPASIGARGPSEIQHKDIRDCLMHTDENGGFLAWEHIRKRKIGIVSTCQEYNQAIEAVSLRFQAWQFLKLGLQKEAQKTHQQAIQQMSELDADWVARSWKKEHHLFASFIHRWWIGMFMFQSRNDQFRTQ